MEETPVAAGVFFETKWTDLPRSDSSLGNSADEHTQFSGLFPLFEKEVVTMSKPKPPRLLYGERVIPDWTMFNRISTQGHFLYRVIFSLSYPDNRMTEAASYDPIQVSDVELCWLIEWMIGKSVSLRTLYRWRNELTDASLIRVENRGPGSSPDTPRVYHILPMEECGYMHIADALSDIRYFLETKKGRQ